MREILLLRFTLMIIIFTPFLFCQIKNQQKLLSDEQSDWLKEETRRQLKGCQRVAYDSTIIYTPDGEGNYGALWTRDFSYMVENAYDLFPDYHIKAGILYLLNNQREDGCIPDRVDVNGMAVYSAGPVNNPLGDPPTDNSQFMVNLVSAYVQQSGDIKFFKSNFHQLIAAMDYTPLSPNGLVFIDPQNPHSPYGFTDTIAKTGELLFSSLLYWDASKKLVRLFEKINNQQYALDFHKRAKKIEKSLDKLWDEKTGMFLAASFYCCQIDIWGNAFAIYMGFPLKDKKDRIVNYLKKNYDKIVMRGQIRHLPTPEHWQKTLIPIQAETYQNGAYWGTASGWMAYALYEQYPDLSKKILQELVVDYQKFGAYECINSDYAKLKNYVVSVTNPLGTLQKLLNIN